MNNDPKKAFADAILTGTGMYVTPPMVRYTAYYQCQFYQEFLHFPEPYEVPDGAYLLSWKGDWLIKENGHLFGLKYYKELPPEMKMMCVVLGLPYE